MRFAAAILSAALLAPVWAWSQTPAPAVVSPGRATPPAASAPPVTTTPSTATATPPATAPGTASTTTGNARRRASAATTPAAAGSADEASAKQKCGADPVVWGNPGSKVYHTTDSRYYGKTKKGSYMCQKDADAAGYHASKSSAARAKKPAASTS